MPDASSRGLCDCGHFNECSVHQCSGICRKHKNSDALFRFFWVTGQFQGDLIDLDLLTEIKGESSSLLTSGITLDAGRGGGPGEQTDTDK